MAEASRRHLAAAGPSAATITDGSEQQPESPGDTQSDEIALRDRLAQENAELRAEVELLDTKAALTKLQAKLNAVSTLYTEAAQREAVLRLQIEQGGGGGTPSYE